MQVHITVVGYSEIVVDHITRICNAVSAKIQQTFFLHIYRRILRDRLGVVVRVLDRIFIWILAAGCCCVILLSVVDVCLRQRVRTCAIDRSSWCQSADIAGTITTVD